MLGDGEAVVLDALGDDETTASTGSMMSEAHAGANGLGTPIAEGRYVALVGPEHFIGGFQPFTCHGVPLVGFDGHTIGSLTISVRAPEHAIRLRPILEAAAHGIEADLIAMRLRARLRELPRTHDWPALERLHQDLLQLHTSGRLEFELASFELMHGRDGGAWIRSARELGDRFARLARIWRILAEPETPVVDEIDAEQLLRDTTELVQTDARMANVTVRSTTTPCGLTRRAQEIVPILMRHHSIALRRAGQAGLVEVAIDERARVTWTILAASAPELSLHFDMPVIRP
jgi:transcriptional regulator of acetoin/glycerol metabolism